LGLRGLVLWLKFNEGSGNIAYDSSFYNNHGTIYGATWTDGKFGKALSFDGVDDYVRTGSVNGFGETITISFWVNHNSIEGEQHYIRGWVNTGFLIWKNRYNMLEFVVVDPDGTWHTTRSYENTISETGRWYHLSFVYDKDAVDTAIYVNGEKLSLKSQDVPTARRVSTSLHIGSYTLSYYFFNGSPHLQQGFERKRNKNAVF